MTRYALLFSTLLALGCHSHKASPALVCDPPVASSAPTPPRATSPGADPQPTATQKDASPPREEPAKVDRVEVPGDTPASIVEGRTGGTPRIVFLPGLCANAYAYLLEFPEASRAHGGALAIEGDKPCGDPDSGFRSLSWDPARQHARLEAAFAALGVSPPPDGLTLVGYSAGAAVGELMVQRWPKRYARAVLIGAPSDPSPARLAKARSVVTMSCSRDVPARMKVAANRLAAKGVPALYLEMPGCTHGSIAEGNRVFGEAFDWLEQNARAPD